MVGGHDRPPVVHLADVALAGVDHRLDGEGHASLQAHALAGAAVVQHLRLFVEAPADAVAAEFAHHAETLAFRVLLDGGAYVTQGHARTHHRDALPHAFVSRLAQAPRLDRRLAHVEHAARVAVPAVLDDGDVDVDDVSRAQDLVAGNAVADLVVHGGADGLGIRTVPGRRVV